MLTVAEAFADSIEKGGMIYFRARFAGLDKEKAEAACRYLKRNDVECAIVGESIPAPRGYEVASASFKPVRFASAANLTAPANQLVSDILNERGYWQGLPRTNALAYAAQPIATARTVPIGFLGTPRDAETAAVAANSRTPAIALRHVANLAIAARKGIQPAPSLAHEALEVAQWASQSSAAAAIQRMSTRFASTEANMKRLSPGDYRVVSPSYTLAGLDPNGADNAEAIRDRLRGQDIMFPTHTYTGALAHPEPLTAEEVQMLLGPDEALVFFLAGANESYVFALTREGVDWRTISLGEKNMAAKVGAFRRGLDVEELTKSVDAGNSELFDLATAHEFYVALLGPVEALIKDKPQLLIVPSGPLTALPFHLLVTDKPAIAVPQMQINEMAGYRDAAWVVKRHAVTVLPSVASLKALRVSARKGQGTKPMIGFGDPVFARNQTAARAADAPRRPSSPPGLARIPTTGTAPPSTEQSSPRHCRHCRIPRRN